MTTDFTHLVSVGFSAVLAEVVMEHAEDVVLFLGEEPEESPELRPPPREVLCPAALAHLLQAAQALMKASHGNRGRGAHLAE